MLHVMLCWEFDQFYSVTFSDTWDIQQIGEDN